MKAIAIILSFFISLLIVQPTVQSFVTSPVNEEACSHECCGSDSGCEDQATNKQEGTGRCAGGICNPFESCCCCAGWTITYPAVRVIAAPENNDFKSPASTSPVLGFCSDCFHPPEIV